MLQNKIRKKGSIVLYMNMVTHFNQKILILRIFTSSWGRKLPLMSSSLVRVLTIKYMFRLNIKFHAMATMFRETVRKRITSAYMKLHDASFDSAMEEFPLSAVCPYYNPLWSLFHLRHGNERKIICAWGAPYAFKVSSVAQRRSLQSTFMKVPGYPKTNF